MIKIISDYDSKVDLKDVLIVDDISIGEAFKLFKNGTMYFGIKVGDNTFGNYCLLFANGDIEPEILPARTIVYSINSNNYEITLKY